MTNMAEYEILSKKIEEQITFDRLNHSANPYAFKDENATRYNPNTHDGATVIRSNFIRDAEKILHCPFYNRYSDKTQVFSLVKNDDLTHRSLHVQLVSRTARTIGKALNLNLELIESIALGHDIGHTPFGHTGEKFLDCIHFSNTGEHFLHNLHSVRVLNEIFPLNLTLQTLDGIACHNGELEISEYRPKFNKSFNDFINEINAVKKDKSLDKKLAPCTLEGCVVRLSDIIAYLGKDRQDAEKNNILTHTDFSPLKIGNINAQIINNLTVNVIENSYGKPYIKMDEEHFSDLQIAKQQNYENIYKDKRVKECDQLIFSMMQSLYDKLYSDLVNGTKSSPIFTHHIDYLNKSHYAKRRVFHYEETDKHQITTDYIASMTDDYFIELYNHLFPKNTINIKYKGYFE